MYLDHIGLSVADLDAMTSWYADALDLDIVLPFAIEVLQLRGVFVTGPHGLTIELLHRPGSLPGLRASSAPEAVLTHGFGHVALRVTDVDGLHAQLIAAGAGEVMAPQDSPEPGVRMSFVSDPEGNLIELLDRKHTL